MDDKNINIIKSTRNIPNVQTTNVNTLNVYDIVNFDSFIITKDAVKKSGGGVQVMRNPHDVIIKPIITEESMDNMAYGKYTFKVDKKANKSEIKKLQKVYSM